MLLPCHHAPSACRSASLGHPFPPSINVIPTVLFDILGKTPISVSADDFTSTSAELPWGYHKARFLDLSFSLYTCSHLVLFSKMPHMTKSLSPIYTRYNMDPTLKLNTHINTLGKWLLYPVEAGVKNQPLSIQMQPWTSNTFFYVSSLLLQCAFYRNEPALHCSPTACAKYPSLIFKRITPVLASLYWLPFFFTYLLMITSHFNMSELLDLCVPSCSS